MNGAVLTEVVISDASFYVGTNDGIVSKFQWVNQIVLITFSWLGKCSLFSGFYFQVPNQETLEITRVLELRSSIYQMDWNTPLGLLLVSSTSRTVVCNTKLKTFSEVGKAYNGKYGACILEEKQGTYLVTARPHQKVWKADIEGKIAHKYNFDTVEEEPKTSTFTVVETSKPKKRTVFSKLFSTVFSGKILTYLGKSIFLIDLEEDTLSPLNKLQHNVLHLKVENNLVYVLDTAGNLYSIVLEEGTLSELVLEDAEKEVIFRSNEYY